MFLPTLFPAIAGAQGHYNIVYIMTDDHTAQMMSCYDKRYISTPNLDRIAADGVRFVNSYVANSLSGPSRACMLTGKHSHKNGFTNNEHGIFDGSQQTMPKLLQKAGYQTALIGKWHLVSTPTGFCAGQLLQPRLHQHEGRDLSGEGLPHQYHHRQSHRLVGKQARQKQTLPLAHTPQGLPPQLVARIEVSARI